MVSVTDIAELFEVGSFERKELRTLGEKVLDLPMERESHNSLLAEMPIKKSKKGIFMPIFIPIWKQDLDFKLTYESLIHSFNTLFYAESSSGQGVK